MQHAITQQLAQIRSYIVHGDNSCDSSAALRSMETTLDECAARAEGALECSAAERQRTQRQRQESQRGEPGIVRTTAQAAANPDDALQASPFSRQRFRCLQAQLNDVVFDLS